MAHPISFLALAGLAAAGSWALTGMIYRVSLAQDLLDHPNDRSSHVVATPRGGGLAIVVAALGGMAAAYLMGWVDGRVALTLGVGMAANAVVGAIDDIRGASAAVRLAVHVATACWTVYMLGGLPAVGLGIATVPLGALGSILAIVAIVWSINLFNFMDGIDGIAGSQGLLVLGFGAWLFWMRGDVGLASISAILAASCLGFLSWNWPPARIFMGDVGSATLGYAVAGIALAAERSGSVSVLAFGILGAVFVADATVTFIRRQRRGARMAHAHRDHAYQRMSRLWASHRRVTLWTIGLTTAMAMLAAVATWRPTLLLPAVAAAYLMMIALLIAVERRAPM